MDAERAARETKLAALKKAAYDTAEPEAKRDYINAMLEWASADATQVYFRVTGALGLAAVYVTQIPMERLAALSGRWTAVLFVGLGCLCAAAVLYFRYVNKTHVARREIARALVDGSSSNPEEILLSVFKRNRISAFGIGNALFGLGAILLGLVLWQVVTQHAATVVR